MAPRGSIIRRGKSVRGLLRETRAPDETAHIRNWHVTAVTARRDGEAYLGFTAEPKMSDLTLEGWRQAQSIEERNQRPLLIALVSLIAAWSVALLIAVV